MAPSLAGPALPFDVQDGGRVDALDLGERDVRLLLVVVVQVEPPRPVTGPTAPSGIALWKTWETAGSAALLPPHPRSCWERGAGLRLPIVLSQP